MRPIPIDLFALNQDTGELTVAPRWLSSMAKMNLSSLQLEPISGSDALSERQVLALIGRLQKLELDSLDSDTGHLAELVGAIYRQPSASMRPIFGPLVDGTIVPDEELALSMLRPGSTFSQRDLLIGLSHPAINLEQRELQLEANLLEPRLNYLLSERVSAEMQRSGLSNEQALELVNVFVRSFYRYHNQEISNSIVNHYLSSQLAARSKKTRKLFNSSKWQINEEADEETSKHAKLSQQQVIVFGSLMDLFEDALTNAPLIKVALIHSSKQLESLLDAFVGQQFEKWRIHKQLDSEVGSANSSESTFDQSRLIHSFVSFAKALFGDTNWPLELHSNSNATLQQPKATYLYQLDSSLLIKELYERINALDLQAKAESSSRRCKEALRLAVHHFQSDEWRHRLTFSCALDPDPEDLDDTNLQTELSAQIHRWLCSKLGRVLANFVASGNVNTQYKTEVEEVAQREVSLAERMEQFEVNCRHDLESDSHSVQLSGASAADRGANSSSNSECKQQLNSLAVEYLVGETDAIERPESDDERWTVFNLFTQRFATLLRLSPAKSVPWQMSSISDESGQFDQRLSLPARAAFWFNFIPALNCTRTQPIVPASLVASSLPSALNSSLLSLNLQFSCQQGARTALDIIGSLISSMSVQLQTMASHWTAFELSQRSQISQNHHNLRMANNSQSGSADEEQTTEAAEELQSNRLLNSSSMWKNSNRAEPNAGKQQKNLLLLAVCLLAISFAIAIGVWVFARRRKPNSCKITIDSEQKSSDLRDPSESSRAKGQSDEEAPLEVELEALQLDAQVDCCPEEATDNFLYDASNHLNLCRSESSMEVSNGPLSISKRLSAPDQVPDLREPIMLPIITTPFGQHQFQSATIERSSQAPKVGCLSNSSNGNHYGGSSSETQAQSSSSLSKKRVKISDPLATARRSHKLLAQTQNRPLSAQLNPNEAFYCPVHRNLSSSSLNPASYYPTSSDLLPAPANDLQWNELQIEMLNQQMSSAANNDCNHHQANFEPQQHYPFPDTILSSNGQELEFVIANNYANSYYNH